MSFKQDGGKNKKISRRRFLKYGFEASLALGIVGGMHALSEGRAYVRPPGSIEPVDFTAKCMRCSLCVEVCPTSALRLVDLNRDIQNISTPVIDPKSGGCSHWQKECLKCVEVCPTGALDKKRAKSNQKMGRVWLKPAKCVNCMVCFDQCGIEGALLFPNPGGEPYKRKADIPVHERLVDSPGRPYIDEDKCIGCAMCVHYCPEHIMYLEPLVKKS